MAESSKPDSSIPDSTNDDLLRLHREYQDKLVAARTAAEVGRANAMVGHLALQLRKLAYSDPEQQKAIQELGAYFSKRAKEESASAGNILEMARQVAGRLNSPEMQQSLENMRRIAGLVGTLYQPPSAQIHKPSKPVGRKADKEAEQRREEQEEAIFQVIKEAIRTGFSELADEVRKQRDMENMGRRNGFTPIDPVPSEETIGYRMQQGLNQSLADAERLRPSSRAKHSPSSDLPPKWVLTLQRAFLAVAGVLAVWIFEKFDVPVWLGIVTLVVCLLCVWFLPFLEKTKTRRVVFFASLVVYLALAATAAIMLRDSGSQVVTPPRTIASAEAELVLLAPKEMHRYRWVPLQKLQIDQGIAGSKQLGIPLFRLKSLSNNPITRIRVAWKILEPVSVRIIFLTSEHFRPYKPTIAPEGSFAPFELHNANGAVSQPASDEDTVDIPYIQATDDIEHSMPLPIAYSYGIRLVATMPRPTNAAPEKGGGLIDTKGPAFEVRIKYSESAKDYERKFRVDSRVLLWSDNTGGPQFPEDQRPVPANPSLTSMGVPMEFRSANNLRAIVTFTVSAAN